MKCVICKKGIPDVAALHRINAKGQPGLWACSKHIKQTDAPPIDSVVQAVVDAIGGR